MSKFWSEVEIISDVADFQMLLFTFNVILWSTKIQITLNKSNILWILMFKLQYLYRQIIQLYSFYFVQKKKFITKERLGSGYVHKSLYTLQQCYLYIFIMQLLYIY